MSLGSFADNRQFGRRESAVKAYAALPGHIMLPCIIENISDGGALLLFTEGAAPTQSFRLVVGDNSYNLVCEIRHRASRKVGVRFVRLAEGIALNRHLQRSTVMPEAGLKAAALTKVSRDVSVPSVKAFRLAVLGAAVVDAEPAAGLDEIAAAVGIADAVEVATLEAGAQSVEESMAPFEGLIAAAAAAAAAESAAVPVA